MTSKRGLKTGKKINHKRKKMHRTDKLRICVPHYYTTFHQKRHFQPKFRLFLWLTRWYDFLLLQYEKGYYPVLQDINLLGKITGKPKQLPHYMMLISLFTQQYNRLYLFFSLPFPELCYPTIQLTLNKKSLMTK